MYYNNNTTIFFNREFLKASETLTDLYGQTMHYGYGVFEGIRSYSTNKGMNVFKVKEHYNRLKRSCELINIQLQYSTEELIDVTYELLERNSLTDAYIRPLIFCQANMSLTKPSNVSIMIAAWEWGTLLGNNLLRLQISSFCRPHPRSVKIEAKICGHYVNSILATSEAKENGYDEALLLDCDGYLAEGPGANLFFEKNGILYTPQLGNILPGITRATVLEMAKELKIEIREGLYQLKDLWAADSAFYCGTAAEIIGIESVNDKKFALQWDNSLGKKLQKTYSQLVRTDLLTN